MRIIYYLLLYISILITIFIAASAQGDYSISENGLEFIADHEGTELNLYNDPAGHCTIGTGHLVHLGNCRFDGSDSREQEFLGGITRDQAIELLRSDVAIAERAVNTYVTVPLTQNQFDALVSFTFNLGAGHLQDLATNLNAGHYDKVPQEMSLYVYSNGVKLDGLVNRRRDEGNLFQSDGLSSETLKQITLILYIHNGSSIGPIIPGSLVTGHDGSGNSFQQTVDSSGYVIIIGDPGTWFFTVISEGYVTNTWSQPITETCTRNAFLEPEQQTQDVQPTAEPTLQLSGSSFSDYLRSDWIEARLESTRGSEGLEDWGGHPRGMNRGQSSNWVPPNIPTTYTPEYTTQQSFGDTSLGTGDVQATLIWHSSADIDLYVQDPYGDTVSYQSDSVPSGGRLDRDNQCANFEMGRPENIFWPENGAPSGTYKVWVNYYSDCNDVGPVAWTVRTLVKGQTKTYSGTINEEGDDQDVTTFRV